MSQPAAGGAGPDNRPRGVTRPWQLVAGYRGRRRCAIALFTQSIALWSREMESPFICSGAVFLRADDELVVLVPGIPTRCLPWKSECLIRTELEMQKVRRYSTT